MFFGQYDTVLKSNNMIDIPGPMREGLSGSLYVTRGFERNLLLMGEKVFQEIYRHIIALNIADPFARLLLRLVLGNAVRLELNNSGGILIPPHLALLVDLGKEVVLLGQGDYLEIWSPANWNKQATALMDIDANAERFAQLNLALY